MTKPSCNAGSRIHMVQPLDQKAIKSLKHILRAGQIPVDRMDGQMTRAFLSQGLATQKGNFLVPSKEARHTLRRYLLQKEEQAAFQSQYQRRDYIPIEENDAIRLKSHHSKRKARSDRLINRAESPLLLMANRKNADGTPLLSPAQVEAGERLRADFERGQQGPAMGINWQRLGQGGLDSRTVRAKNDYESMSCSAQEALQRWRKALNAVGEEFAGPLVDFCCFLNGLEKIERQRRWPARSAKLVMSLALNALARHYGLQDEATGPQSNPMRHWGEEDYRPNLN